jgi:hypothetical protein
MRAKDPIFKAGLLAKFIGQGLILAGAVALLTNLSSALVWFCFILGIASHSIGTAQFLSASRTRRKAQTQPPN